VRSLNPRLVLALVVVVWVALVFAGSVYKYQTLGQGYDQVDFEQAIWNTVQGRPMEDSRFSFTDSIFGMDWMPMLFAFVPFYALVPSALTLFFLQIVGAGLGAIPLYWLARDRLGSAWAGVGAAAAYLLYPTLQYGVMNPFQVRLFSVTLLLFAFYYFEKARWPLFAVCAGAAMLARTDVALVVAMFGLYGLLTRRKWPWIMVPLAGGLAYFALATFVIVPAFLHPDALRGPQRQTPNYMDCWPCGHNPVLAYYGHLGSTFPEIITYIFTHPIEVAQLMLTEAKLGYLTSLLLPLAFLPLLSPRPLVLGLPILALNLLSQRTSQFSYQTHYSLLIIPGLFAAAIYGADNLANWLAKMAEKRDAMTWLNAANAKLVIMFGLVGWVALMNIPYKNPAVRAVLYHEPAERVAAARSLIAMVPPEAKVASSSFLGAYLLPRRYIYNFPPAPYSPYNFGPQHQSDRFVDPDYILVDPNASALRENPVEDKSALEQLRTMPEWKQVVEKEGYLLFKREE
jgi:uncharacterized membrane protein